MPEPANISHRCPSLGAFTKFRVVIWRKVKVAVHNVRWKWRTSPCDHLWSVALIANSLRQVAFFFFLPAICCNLPLTVWRKLLSLNLTRILSILRGDKVKHFIFTHFSGLEKKRKAITIYRTATAFPSSTRITEKYWSIFPPNSVLDSLSITTGKKTPPNARIGCRLAAKRNTMSGTKATTKNDQLRCWKSEE